ncbi:MAG TPA: BamA/TamA family outer membrane protein [Anaeromyxobacter sp.]
MTAPLDLSPRRIRRECVTLAVALAILAFAAPAAGAAPPAATPAPEAGPPPDLRPADPNAPARGAARRYQIEKIRIDGLSHVKEFEVRRRLLVAEGEVLDEERVLLSRLRLLQLGWFSRVETHAERGSERGLVVLVFDVAERNTILVTDLVLASTDPQPLYGGFGLSQQNFLGRGLGLSGAFVYGGAPSGRPQDPDRFAIRASLFAPDVDVPGARNGMVFGGSLLFLHGEELACADPRCDPWRSDLGAAPVIRYSRVGAEGTVGGRPGPFERIHATFRYERLDASRAGAPPPTPDAGPYVLQGRSAVAALVGTWELDTRDDFFLPREGLRALAQVTFGSKLLGGDYEYSRYRLDLDTAYALLGRPLRFQATLGAAQGNPPFFERFYGADYSYFAVGPALARALELNFSTDSRYDQFLAMAGLEYAVPLWASSGFFRRGYVAVGGRGVYSTATLGGSRTSFSSTPLSGDVALRLDTPVGMFNVSVAYWLDIAL